MSRSFLVDSLIEKDTKPRIPSNPVDFFPQRYPYHPSDFTNYLAAMGRVSGQKVNECIKSGNLGVTASVKFEPAGIQTPSSLFPNFYPKDLYQPFCYGVDLSSAHLSASKGKLFRPVPLPGSKGVEDAKGDNTQNHIETPKKAKGNYF